MDGKLHACDTDIPICLLYLAVVVKLYLVLSVSRRQYCNVPDLEQFLQVLLIEKIYFLNDTSDG